MYKYVSFPIENHYTSASLTCHISFSRIPPLLLYLEYRTQICVDRQFSGRSFRIPLIHIPFIHLFTDLYPIQVNPDELLSYLIKSNYQISSYFNFPQEVIIFQQCISRNVPQTVVFWEASSGSSWN